jgi:hypothetical protein
VLLSNSSKAVIKKNYEKEKMAESNLIEELNQEPRGSWRISRKPKGLIYVNKPDNRK